ncbi:MAG: hypothetical protein RL311_689 [Bacteroidota bacterium]|jgi:hypothetical protein|uniref:hypothetical protein n=1 Tax=Flavobacterium sp. TaxID=239 RepID=UPI00286F4750|nr:hypothetical protein [Flavobacterium sp.]
MNNIFKFLIFIVFIQTSFAQNFDKKLLSKKTELNLSFEPKMRGIESNNVVYYIEKDIQTLSAYENGKLKWQTNIISVCGKPSVGKSEIRVIKPETYKLLIVFGKHSFAEVDIKNGKTKYLGAD